MYLNELEMGKSAIVEGIEGKEKYILRFSDFGISTGTTVKAICRAPLGDPTVFLAKGVLFAIRNSDSAKIKIREL